MSVLDVTSLTQQAIAGARTRARSASSPNDLSTTGASAQQAPVPFWDVPPSALGDSTDGDGSTSNNSFNAWDVCALGGRILPGLAKVTVKDRKRFDIKKAKGKNGATLTFTGYDPSDVSIELRVWTPVHLNALNSMMSTLKQKASTGAAGAQATAAQLAMDISHPATTLLGIHSVLIEGISSLEPTGQKGVMKMEIHCLEYVAPAKGDVTTTPAGSSAFHNVPAINASQQSVPMPSQNASYTGPNGALASFPP